MKKIRAILPGDAGVASTGNDLDSQTHLQRVAEDDANIYCLPLLGCAGEFIMSLIFFSKIKNKIQLRNPTSLG
jgi:hypothetical protein